MALGIFCELSESVPGSEIPLTLLEEIHDKALGAVRDLYDDSHVFPYLSKAHFHLRHRQCKQAIECYAKAAQVLSRLVECEISDKKLVSLKRQHYYF